LSDRERPGFTAARKSDFTPRPVEREQRMVEKFILHKKATKVETLKKFRQKISTFF